jgi:hypothetical protein
MTMTSLALVSALMFAQAGEKKDAPKPPAPATPPAAVVMASVIFVNAVPDAEKADVYVNGKKEVAADFGKASKPFETAAGEIKVEFKAGEKTLGAATALKVAADKHYTIVATGKNGEAKYQLIEAKYTAGKAHVIVFHASPDAGKVDVKVDGKEANKGLEMGKSFEAPYDGGKHKFEVMAGSEAAALTKELDLKADSCYCVFVTGLKAKLEFAVVEQAKPAPKKG